MIIENLLLNPIVISTLTCEHDIIKQKHLNTLLNTSFNNNNPDTGGVYVSSNRNLLNLENLSEIKNDFIQAAKIYTLQVLKINNEFKMTNSWLTKNEKGSKHHAHSHPNTLFSAVTYFDADLLDDSFSQLEWDLPGLKNNFKEFNFTFNILEWINVNCLSWSVIPRKNQIIIFPGSVLHHSRVNLSEKPRYCLGANFFISGTVGCDEDINKIVLN